MSESLPTEDDVFQVVRAHLVDIVGNVDPEDVQLDSSMKDLGASSLDIVDVVSCTTRELRLRVPRAELTSVDQIRPLVALLARLAKEPEHRGDSD